MAEPVEIPIVVTGEQAAFAKLKTLRDLVTDIEKGAKVALGGLGGRGGIRVSSGDLFDGSISASPMHRRPTPSDGITDRWAKSMEEMLSRGIAGLGLDLFKSGLDLATQGLKTFAGFLLNDVIKPFTVLETRAQQIANASSGKLTGVEISGAVRAEKLRSNIGEDKLLEAAEKFQDITGESVLAFQMLDTIGMLTKGRGGSATEQAAFAASVFKQGMTKADLDRLLLGFTGQGDIGSIPLQQMARLGGKVVAPAGQMAGEYSQRILTSTGLLQAARPGFGTVDLASTGLNTFFTNVSTQFAKLEMGGLGKFFEVGAEGKRVVSDPAALIGALLAKTSGNISDLKKLGFTDPGARLVGAFGEQFKGGFQAAKARGETDEQARASAGKAVEAYIKTFVSATSSMEAESKKRDAVMATTGERWESAMNRIKDKMLSVMPAVEKLVDSFEQRAPDIADAAEKLATALIDIAEFLDKWVIGRDTTTAKGREREFARESRQFSRAAEEVQRAGGGVALKKYLEGQSVVRGAEEEAIAALEKTTTTQAFRAKFATMGRGYTAESEAATRQLESGYMRSFIKDIEASPEQGMKLAEGAMKRGELSKEQFDILAKLAAATTKSAQDFGTLSDAMLDAVKGLKSLADSAGEAAKSKPLGQ